jgi:enterochelin esterase-like enzyme
LPISPTPPKAKIDKAFWLSFDKFIPPKYSVVVTCDQTKISIFKKPNQSLANIIHDALLETQVISLP